MTKTPASIHLLSMSIYHHVWTMCLRASCVIAVLVTAAIGVTIAQIPSEMRRTGFNGEVRIVRLEIKEYSWEDSQWKSWGDPIRGVTLYDRDGRCLSPSIDPGSGWRPYGVPLPPASAAGSQRYEIDRKSGGKVTWRTVWQFDQEGRLERFEAYGINENGPSLSHWEQYTYDEQGRVAERTYWYDWGWSPNQTEPYPPIKLKYWFDTAGRIGGWSSSKDPRSRVTLTYDKKGRLIKHVDEQADGNIVYLTTYALSGYDRQGNWTAQTITKAWRTDEGDDLHTKTVLRRSITYEPTSNRVAP